MPSTTDKPFEIYPYSITKLKEILIEKSDASIETIEDKSHCIYFDNYFGYLKTSSILVENSYIDRDFLEDFSNYYVRCFQPYDKKCTRVHFFNIPFTQEDFISVLNGNHPAIHKDKLNNSYLGFIVIKPLPKTIIGRSCLVNYDSEGGRRNFPTTREYIVHLFGMRLRIKSLAFQEQDRVVAACATSALWSVFHRTGILFQHPILSPVDITKAACDHLPLISRTFPNIGLTDLQMAFAIRSVSLEPLLVNAIDQNVLKTIVYAYLNIGVPIIMSILLYDFSVTPPKYVDRHAVAITGFSLGHPAPIPIGSNSFLTKASRINELYAHDDQVGPFARMVLNQGITDIEINGDIKPVDTVSTSLGGGHLKAVPDTLLIPLYHKIRISFDSIQHVVSHLDNLLEIIRINGIFSIPGPIEWDIRLTETNKLKEDIFSCTHLNNDIKQDVLLSSLPRFIWRATGCANNAPLLDLIFDATDIEQGLSLTRAIRYNNDIYDCLTVVSKYPVFKTEPVWKILKWFSTL